jgi:hypothetical protein
MQKPNNGITKLQVRYRVPNIYVNPSFKCICKPNDDVHIKGYVQMRSKYIIQCV